MNSQSPASRTNRSSTPLCALFLVCAAAAGGSQAWAAQVPWTGQAVDIRSGQPLASTRLWGGFQGRTDATEASTTGGDGRFTVVYAAPLDLAVFGYYKLTAAYIPDGGLYFENERKTSYPSETIVRMVPRNAYIRCLARDKLSGQPLANVSVSLGVPGAVWQTVKTDAQGGGQFRTPAYVGSGNYEEGIPADQQVPHEAYQQAVPRTDYWLEVSAPGYKTLRTPELPLPIGVLSSASPELYTFITLELVANADTVNQPAASAAIQNPYAERPTLAIARAVKVSFATRTGVRYQLQRSAAADGPWENVGPVFTGDGAAAERYFDAEPDQARYYRAEVVTQ